MVLYYHGGSIDRHEPQPTERAAASTQVGERSAIRGRSCGINEELFCSSKLLGVEGPMVDRLPN